MTGQRKKMKVGTEIKGATPSSAVSKAVNRFCREHKIEECKIKITVEEVTEGKTPKKFSYSVERKRVDKEVVRDGVAIIYQYSTNTKKTVA